MDACCIGAKCPAKNQPYRNKPAMSEFQIENKTVELINQINAAITNVRLYPPTSALIARSIERLSGSLEALLEVEPAVIYAEAEKNLLVQGAPLPEREQQRPQIQSFLSMLLTHGVKSITFEKGVREAELVEFVQLLGSPLSDQPSAGELKHLMGQRQISHILIDEKFYVERDADETILSGMKISDEDIARAVFGDEPVSETAKQELRELAKQPEWIAQVFQSGVKQAGASKDRGEPGLAERFSTMIDTLANLSSDSRREVSQAIVNSMAEMDESALQALLTQNLNTVFGARFFEDLAQTMDGETFNRLYERVAEMIETAPAEAEKSLRDVLAAFKEAPMAQKDLESPEIEEAAGSVPPGDGATADMNTAEDPLKSTFNRLLKGDVDVLPRLTLMQGVRQAVERIMSSGREATINALFDRLVKGLENSDPSIKAGAAEMISEMDGHLSAGNRLAERIAWSKKLTEWIKQESEITEAFETISRQLQGVSESLIQGGRSAEATHILDAYRFVASGNLSKDQTLQALAANVLQNLATDDILDLLLKGKADDGKADDAFDVYSLVILGSTNIERLLDRLRDSHNRRERNRIVQAVTQIGEAALPPVIERLAQPGPWYYIRNLVMLLGRIGDDRHLETLERFLDDADARVQREAVLAVQNIGGEKAGRVLLNRLDEVSDEVKPVVISVLGIMNYRQALAYLIMSLENRSLGATKEAKAEINAKICGTLGKIGDAKAIPVLEKIAKARGFMGIKIYDPKVKTAAAKALRQISCM